MAAQPRVEEDLGEPGLRLQVARIPGGLFDEPDTLGCVAAAKADDAGRQFSTANLDHQLSCSVHRADHAFRHFTHAADYALREIPG